MEALLVFLQKLRDVHLERDREPLYVVDGYVPFGAFNAPYEAAVNHRQIGERLLRDLKPLSSESGDSLQVECVRSSERGYGPSSP